MSALPVIDTVRREAKILNRDEGYRLVLDGIGESEIVLLGEATHGTYEFYRARAEITRRLIVEKGFAAIAVECDWPDALQASRFIQSDSNDYISAAEAALGGYTRFPRWMWRNMEVLTLMNWLRVHNSAIRETERRIGFFGLDLYSLRSSMDAVIDYLSRVDPEEERRARARYACFDHMAEDPQQYGFATNFGLKPDCEREATQQLVSMATKFGIHMHHDGIAASDEAFYAEQNARVAKNAEAYYRAMFQGSVESWNVRDTHMADTLDTLRAHLAKRGNSSAKIVVWAHNSHIGDARATEMGDRGQINLGRLARERYGGSVFLLGFTTYAGTVTAASDWGGRAEVKAVVPSRTDSFEYLLHQAHHANFFLPIRGRGELVDLLHEQHLERAIGVVYLPDTERISHYFHADLSSQFDGVVHFDVTHALKPLDRISNTAHEELPETYPSGM